MRSIGWLLLAWGCPAAPADDPTPPPSAAVCGNGVLEAGEACDRGPANADDAACTRVGRSGGL